MKAVLNGARKWSWAHKHVLVASSAVFLLSTWVTITSVTYFKTLRLWTHTVEDIRDLERSYATLLADTQHSAATFLDEIKNFDEATDDRLGAIKAVRTLRYTLLEQLEERERKLDQISRQQERANQLIADFEESISGTEGLLQNVVAEKSFLKERLTAAQMQLDEVSQQRDAGRRVETGLRWRLDQLEADLASAQAPDNDHAESWLKEWVTASTEALEDLFGQTGVDLEVMIARAAQTQAGQGGPFELASLESSEAADDPLTADIQRLAMLQRLASSLPLGSPLDHYTLTSSFGKRSDPLTNELAFHGGLDFGAAPNAKIRATAHGRVVHAGPLGPYGNTVEIDHGMGVTTRFGHMKSVTVAAGQEVDYRDVIGVIGSTGRSTGRHLHYEVRLDGEAYDPAKFMNTGRYLIWAFDAAAQS